MEQRVLVAYATRSGSTGQVAQAIGLELAKAGAQVDVRALAQAGDVSAYDAVVIGGPMIMGWHRDAVKFVAQRQQALSRVPTAYFLTALSLTKYPDDSYRGVPLYQDLTLAKVPQNGRLSIKERYATVAHYLGPVLRQAPQVRPVSAGFFDGALELSRLDLISRLFVRYIVGARSGDYRNWAGIRAWAADLCPALLGMREAAL